VDRIADIELQKYLRLHAATDDFSKTVSKARQFVDANELSCTAKKPAIRSPNVNYQTIVDAVSEVLNQRDRNRTVDVNLVQSANCATSDNRNRKASPRQGSPAPSNSSAGSVSSRASTPTRTVRFQDQAESGSASGRGRWQNNQSPQGNGNNQRPWAGQRPQGQRSPSPRPPSPSQSGPRPALSLSERQWAAGQGAPRLRPPAPPNTGNWRPGWRSPTGDGDRPSPAQPQNAPPPRRWLQNFGCHVCGKFGCHSLFHEPDAVSPQMHLQEYVVLCVASGDATHPATRLEFRRRYLVPRGRHPASRRDQHL